MRGVVFFDCEFLCIEGSQRRFWCGGQDPDPVIAQIGAVKLGLAEDFPILETFARYVIPHERTGKVSRLDPFFTQLTGISNEHISSEGVSLAQGLAELDKFAEGALLWSWGKDELNMVAISCYIEGITAPIPAQRFDNAVKLLIAGGMPIEDLARTPSSRLAEYYGVAPDGLTEHDALSDALSLSLAVQHLLRDGALDLAAFT
jgi:hypothetical protein